MSPPRNRYEVVITGDLPPFKWKVERVGLVTANRTTLPQTGKSDSVEDAMFDASEVAHMDAAELRHAATTRREVLFESGGSE